MTEASSSTIGREGRPSRRRWRGPLWLGMTAVALVFWHAAFRRLSSTGSRDWGYYVQMWEASRVGFQRFGELALWNPYQCGGISLWGNPQQWSFSPLFYPTLLIGTAAALKLRLILLNTLGLVSMYVLARHTYGLTRLGALIAAVPWACSGFFSWHNLAGHAAFQTCWLFPWVIYGLRRSESDARFCAVTAALIGLMVVDGGSYPLTYLGLLVAVDTLPRLLAAPAAAARRRILASLGWTGMLALLLASLRLIPSLSTLTRRPRNLADSDAIGLSDVLAMLTARRHEWTFDPHPYVWHEYACFVGWTVLVLGLLGFSLGVRKRPALAAGAVFFLLCTLGHVASYFPWPLLKRLPVLASMRIPSRFVVLFSFYLTLLAGFCLDWLRERLGRRGPHQRELGTRLAAGVVTLALVDLFVVNLSVNDIWRGRDLPTEPPAGRFHLVPEAPVMEFRARFASFPQLELGSAQCYEPLPWPVPAGLWTGDVPQARVSGKGRVLDWGHTTNTAWAEVDLEAPARVIFNQTFALGWQSSRGVLVEDAGRIAVDAVPGKYRLDVRYSPRDLPAAIGVSLLGAALTALTGVVASPQRLGRWREAWRRRRDAARP